MHVVSKEAGRAPLQTSRTACKTLAVKLRFRDVMFGTDRNRAQRSRVGVRRGLVIHRNIKETRSAQSLALRLNFFQMAAEGFFTG